MMKVLNSTLIFNMTLPPVRITVEGMGGGINFEMQIIEKALKEAGIEVEVINDAADWECSNEPGWFERSLERSKTKKNIRAVLKANHLPWGG
jgi:hypothetical protein